MATSDGWRLAEGPIIGFSVAPIRSFVTESMRHERMFLAGDAAHIAPPTGAKGLNLAVRDVTVLAPGADRAGRGARRAPRRRLHRHVPRPRLVAQHFSSWLTGLVPTSTDSMERRLARAELRTVVSRNSARRLLAENYVGIAMVR